MNIIENLLTPNKYSRPQTKLKKINGIVVHYVGNPNTSALANRNYFNNLKNGTNNVYASSHYIIDMSGSIIRCVPESEVAYASNSRNYDTISIECCHPDSTGKFTEATHNALVELCADICQRYKLNPIKNIIRHYDVTKKCCPRWWSPNGGNPNANKDFISFKNDVKKYMENGDDEVVENITVCVNGKGVKTQAILKDEHTFVKLRDLTSGGFEVGYDANTKLRTLNNRFATIPIEINGIDNNIQAVNLNGYNYVSIRDIAEILDIEIDWQGSKIILRQ